MDDIWTQSQSMRQQKVARQIQKDLSDILIKEGAGLVRGSMTTVTSVRMTPDLSIARVHLSIFPFEKSEEVMENVEQNSWVVRKALGERIRHQFRIVPELTFFLDDSLEYEERMDGLINKKE